jgi:serine/threonine-protein kinase
VLAVLVVSGVAIWLLHPWQRSAVGGATDTSTATAPRPPAAESQARLASLLPAGYPPGTCNPVTPPKTALAKTSCDKNSDPYGPPSGTFLLFPDAAAQHDAFNRIVQSTNIIECPGRIQSPGPWHRNVAPEKNSGTLLCGSQHGNATVAWTNDSELRVSIVQAESQGPTLEQLYAWWTMHS